MNRSQILVNEYTNDAHLTKENTTKNPTISDWNYAVEYAAKRDICPVTRHIKDFFRYTNISFETATHCVEIANSKYDGIFIDMVPKSKSAKAKLTINPTKKYLREILRSSN